MSFPGPPHERHPWLRDKPRPTVTDEIEDLLFPQERCAVCEGCDYYHPLQNPNNARKNIRLRVGQLVCVAPGMDRLPFDEVARAGTCGCYRGTEWR